MLELGIFFCGEGGGRKKPKLNICGKIKKAQKMLLHEVN
jgi:hypothetical protein